MAVQDDATSARDAVHVLRRAADALGNHYGDTVDARRLKVDVERVAEDLELLCGGVPAPVTPPRLQVIDDAVYPQDFWMDAEDEGLGGGR